MADFTPTPFLLDSTVLHELACGDGDIIGLVQSYDASGQPMVVPALAITGTLLETPTEEAADALHGLALLEEVTVAPLQGTEQAAALAEVMTITELDAWDAHVAAVADVSICPILTLDAAKWQQPSAALDEPLHIIEIVDPDGGEPD